MESLQAGEIHVWTATLPSNLDALATLEPLLNQSERAAANRFVFERHRIRYIFSHGLLRRILSSYVHQAPEEISFTANSYGKPFLAGNNDSASPQFNMSHSGDAVMVALTRSRLIGVDIEALRPLEFAGIAKSHFTNQERAFIQESPADAQQHAFFTCWTRKEAFIKAVGKGLSIPLNTFDTYIAKGRRGLQLSAPKESPGIDAWWLQDLRAPDGYASAVAVEEGFDRVVYREWGAI
jgi:4'-phosphopantetheinyl transferase